MNRIQTAGCCFLFLFILDNLYLLVTHIGSFLVGTGPTLLFLLMGLSSALLFAFPLAAASFVSDSLFGRFKKRQFNPRIGLRLNSTLLLVTGLLIANSRSGQIFKLAPIHHNLAVLLPGLVYYVSGRFYLKRIDDPTRFNFFSATAFLTALGIIAAYLEEFVKGRFGFSGSAWISGAAMLAVVTAVIFFFHGYFVVLSGKFSKRIEFLVTAALSVSLALLHWLNAFFYVDQYYMFHFVLSLMSLLLAWHLAEKLSLRYPLKPLRRWRLILVSGVLLSLCCVVYGARPASITGYVAGIHTVHYRMLLEPFYRMRQNLQDIEELAFIFSRRVLKQSAIPFFIHPALKLPDTFQQVSLTPSVDRPDIENLVIFFLDAKRPKDVGLYKERTIENPLLKQYFSDAFIFNNAISAGNQTKSALPSFYSGAYPKSVQYNFRMKHPPFWYKYQDGNSLGHLFQKAGFQTVVLTNDHYYFAYFNKKELEPVFGGFSRIIKDDDAPGNQTEKLIRAYQQSNGIIPKQGRFVAVVHMMEHSKTITPKLEEMISLVCKEIKDKGRWNKTVAVLLADHGFQVQEHGRAGYGKTLFNEEIRVPFIIRIPGIKGREVNDTIVSVDHLPTLLDLFGIPTNKKLEGKSYLPAFYGMSLNAERPMYMQSKTASAIRIKNTKLIKWFKDGPFALFDLSRDPSERFNLVEVPAYRDIFLQLRSTLDRFDNDHPFF